MATYLFGGVMTLPTTPDPHTPSRGSLIGPWRVLERIDSGSFGIIYRVTLATEPSARPFAMKVAAQPGDERFEREALLLTLVSHPGLPRFQDAGTWEAPGGRRYPYLVMELVEGVPLYQWATATGRRLTSRQVLRMMAQVARALEALHEHGLHRDVKGDNILVGLDGRAVLLDLGAGWLPGSRTLTEGALPPGTPQYRSPEALDFREHNRGDPEAHYEARPADDIYALRVTAYRLVTGSYPPEPGGSGRFLPPSAMETVAPELEAPILRMLSHPPESRGTAGALAHALESAAAAERTELDAPLLPSAAVLPTEHTRLRGPWGWRVRVLARAVLPRVGLGAIAFGVVGLLRVATLNLGREGEAETALPLFTGHLREAAVPDAADAGVGEEALLSVAQVPRPPSSSSVLGLPLPKGPQPGQRRPPCDTEYEIAANGACWVILEKKPPCGAGGYEHAGKCVRASFDAPPTPTSGEP